METIADVWECWKEVHQNLDLWGCTSEWKVELLDKFGAIGNALMEEQGISDANQAPDLPDSTPLGEKSLAAFRSFKDFFEQAVK